MRSIKSMMVLFAIILLIPSCVDNSDKEEDRIVNPIDIACLLADTWITTYSPEDASFSWDSGLLMLGLWELYERTGEVRYRDYVKRWLDYHINRGYVIAFNDHVPPARIALRLWRETRENKYFKVIQDARDYVLYKASRTPDGGLNHMGWISGNQLWVDTLFMVTPFLMELGRELNDKECFDEAVRQFEIFSFHLRDEDTGLYRHMYDADTGELMPPVSDYWARGNAWVVAASGTAFGLLPSNHTGYESIRSRFIQQVNSIERLMHPSGRWHVVMNRPNTYLETSAGLIISYGIYEAIKAGITSKSMLWVAERALSGGMSQIVFDPIEGALLLGTSYGTPPSTWEGYQYILKGEQVNYGVGAFILAAVARHDCGIKTPLTRETTDETYIKQPLTDDRVELGYFYLARGNLSKSLEMFSEAIRFNEGNTQALFGISLIELMYFVLHAVDLYSLYSIGHADVHELLSFLGNDAREFGRILSERMKIVERDENFIRIPERVVISIAGNTAVGSVELDLGEVYLLDAIGLMLWGLGDLVLGFSTALSTPFSDSLLSACKLDIDAIVEGLDNIATALGVLVEGINIIDSELDDQTDDLLPSNLFRLEGMFDIPGVLLPTPVEDVWKTLGINPRELFGEGPMPQAMIDWLLNLKEIVEFIRDLIANIGGTKEET